MAERAKLGNIFNAAPSPRPADLAGLLDSRPPVTEPAETLAQATPLRTPSTTDVAESPQRPQRTRTAPRPARRASSNGSPEALAAKKVVPVVLDASILAELRTFAARMEHTQGTIALRAIEAHAKELATHWTTPESGTQPGRLFGTTSAVRRRVEPGVQTQLRITETDAATLDRLVGDWNAPSRSALVNEALRRYVTDKGASRTAV